MTTSTLDHMFFDEMTRTSLEQSNGRRAVETAEAITTLIIERQQQLTWEELTTVVQRTFGHVPGIYGENTIIRPLINISAPENVKGHVSAAINLLLTHPRGK